MIKKLLLNALIFSGLLASAQTTYTVTYDFAATTSLTGVTDPTPSPTVTGITCGSFVAVGTPSTNPNATGRFSFVGWPTGGVNGATTYSSMTGSISTSEYYEVTLTPVSGYTVTLNSIGLKFQRSATGVRSYAVRSSIDSYTANLPATVSSNTNIIVAGSNEFFIVPDANSSYTGSLVDLTASTFTFATATSFRFYGWNSEATTGTFSIDDVVFDGSVSNGTVACVPASISSINGNAPICANQILNLGSSVLGDAPFTYTWTGSGTIGTPNASSTTISGATSSDYTLTVSNACGTATSVITATVNALPAISVNSATICAGSSATLTATGATTYSWSTGSASASITASPLIPNTYTVTGTDNNNCSDFAVSSVQVNTVPNVSVNSVAICAGNSATLTASGNATSYTWNTGQSTPSIIVTPTMSPVDYTVIGTDANNCSSDAVGTVTVNALPTVSLSLIPNLQCVTINSVTLTGGSPSNGTYSGTAVTGSDFSPATAGVGSYTITYMFTDGNNCSNMATDVITVDACTGIQTLNADVVSIYPNPSNGLVVVKTPALNAQVTVFDINGKNVFTQTTASFETSLDLSHLANGVYQLNIVSDNKSFNHKVMINK
ncbi:MAG: T9SS type A sorting domain-containing protein [Bacteroidia bacterium]|nr:T9SS type A sorting domain-containing protein [Bacteroidia bacterium]